ncbi:MAG: hypothetical protein M1840_005590 [Geoglossum simile]|nr:MAG: hypothetical protein M1840_005590 [Geoglossum simile]
MAVPGRGTWSAATASAATAAVPASIVSAETLTKISTKAAQDFVDKYYPTLQTSRATLSSFYMPSTKAADGKTLPVLVFNGKTIPDPPALQTMFEKDMPTATYEVQSFDCHPLNPNYNAAGPGPHPPESGRNMSILISVSGYVKFADVNEDPLRGFHESFVLVPNTAIAALKAGEGVRSWLIQSQTFRFVV